MSTRKKKISLAPWVLAAVAVLFLVGPRWFPHRARASLAFALIPLRVTAQGMSHLIERASPGVAPAELEKQLIYYKSKTQELHEKYSAAQAQLSSVSGLREVLKDPDLRLLPASVIVHADSSIWRRTLAIDRGSIHGVRKGQPVLCERHLVGRVLEVGMGSSQVQLVSDSAFRIGAVIVPQQQEGSVPGALREIGVFQGDGESGGVLKWAARDRMAEEGAIAVTTPDPDLGIPRGLIIGRVMETSLAGPYPRVTIAPFVRPRALEGVVVLLGVER